MRLITSLLPEKTRPKEMLSKIARLKKPAPEVINRNNTIQKLGPIRSNVDPMGFTRTSQRNQDATMKSKSELISIKF